MPTTSSIEGLRAKFREPRGLLATFIMIPRVEVVELAAVAGFDAVFFDLEHGPMGPAELPALAAAARGAGLVSIARLAGGRAAEIGGALDAGVDGVLVPHVASSEAARQAVSAARFPPEGIRSVNPYVRGTGYDGDRPSVLQEGNARAAVVALIEGREAIDDLDAILAIPGLDCIFVGPVDLSGALGYPGQPEHPRVVAEAESIFARAATRERAAAVYAPTPERARFWFERGARLVAVSCDVAMALDSFKRMAGRARPT